MILEYFMFSIIFEHSHIIVHLSNVSVYGNEQYIGCSSVLSQYSVLHIKDSKFNRIPGSHGAAMMVSRSCVIFTGNNVFSDNSAPYGGSLYIFESVITLSGINIFRNNSSPKGTRSIDSRCLVDEDYWLRYSGGGVIYCKSSTVNINSEYSVIANNSAQNSGGAIYARNGNITIKGSVAFMDNVAYEYAGGAIFLYSVNLIVIGDISFINNEAHYGGALSISSGAKFLIVSEVRMANQKSTFNDATKFCRNVAAMNGRIEFEAEYVRVHVGWL
jgi:predicted outer membrane repeat protein